MRTADYQRLLDRVNSLPLDETAKQVVADDIKRDARERGVTRLERGDRVGFAQRLLRQKVSVATVRMRLMALYGIGKTQAYDDITEALNFPEKQQESGRKEF